MDELRVYLVVVGIAIVVAIYFVGRRQLEADDKRMKLTPDIPWSALFSRLKQQFRHFKQTRMPKEATHPVLTPEPKDTDLEEIDAIVPDKQHGMEDVSDDVSLIVELTSEQIAPAGEQLFIPITIMGRHGRRFEGEQIQFATEQSDFVLKDTGIYYYEVADAQGYKQNLLGLANII